MSDRTYVAALLATCAVVLLGLGWVVLKFTSPPREAHRAEVSLASTDQLQELTEQVRLLAQEVSASGIGGGAATRRPAPGQPPAGEVLVVWTDDPIAFVDPDASGWDAAPTTIVPLQVQDQTMPVLDQLSVYEVEVAAITNGRQIGWRVSWADPDANYHLDTDLFCDAVGLQFPLITNADYKMGAVDFPVQIIQWKAIWQKDIDEHFQDVQDLHPNYWADLYWFAEGEFPYPVPESFQRAEALDWFIAYSAGNPIADMYRVEPVQELIAEGYGTLTHQPDSVSVGRGAWKDGRWSVVFARPMETNDPADYQFEPGTRDLVAFAVWQGAADNVGGRKQHSQWVIFEVQQ